jgi:hypothetical protein
MERNACSDESTNTTIQTHWHADRVHLWRVGMPPSQRFISSVTFDRFDYAFELILKKQELAVMIDHDIPTNSDSSTSHVLIFPRALSCRVSRKASPIKAL